MWSTLGHYFQTKEVHNGERKIVIVYKYNF